MLNSHSKASYDEKKSLFENIQAAKGERPCDLVIKNAKFLDVYCGKFVSGDIAVHQGMIVGICESYDGINEIDATGQWIVPGFVDSHVHIESSLMTPVRFQEAVLPCGTTTAIWDPHEIANVKGTDGIKWALEASDGLELDVFLMVPSCVPSTTSALELESSGAELVAQDLRQFRDHPRVLGLAEMMNFPGLLMGDDDVLQKITDFSSMKRDGHCPGLTGKDLNAYGVAGIHSCHESTSIQEAQEKLSKGIHVLIREGSCAKNAETLLPLLNSYTSSVLSLCSDDRNPADIQEQGHINYIIDYALRQGIAPEEIFRIASFAPCRIYGLEDRGSIAPGFLADFCLVQPNDGDNWKSGFNVRQVVKNGNIVDPVNLSQISLARMSKDESKNLHLDAVDAQTFTVAANSTSAGKKNHQNVRVIDVIPNQIVTKEHVATLEVLDGEILADMKQDVLKITVLERHKNTGRKSTAFVRGFGLKSGAIATSINHDSHNVIAVGSDDASLVLAVNRLRDIDGGIVVVKNKDEFVELPLAIGGLMTDASPEIVHEALINLKNLATQLGCSLHEPFLQLSFLALPVIPALKLTDRGLVDVSTFSLVGVAVD